MLSDTLKLLSNNQNLTRTNEVRIPANDTPIRVVDGSPRDPRFPILRGYPGQVVTRTDRVCAARWGCRCRCRCRRVVLHRPGDGDRCRCRCRRVVCLPAEPGWREWVFVSDQMELRPYGGVRG